MGGRRPRDRKNRSLAILSFFKGDKGKVPRRIALGVAGLLLAAVIGRSLRAEPVLMNSAEVATIWDHGALRVGLRTDIPGMCENGEGLEAELAALLAERILAASPNWKGDTIPLEVVEVNSMTVAAKLTDGSIDAAICLMPVGVNSNYAYSGAYYTDPCRFLVLPGRENQPLKNMTIGCIQSASSTSLYVPSGAVYNKLSTYITDHPDDGLGEKPVGYAGYEELFRALSAGAVDAIYINDLMLKKYGQGQTYAIHPTDGGSIGYGVATLSSNSAVATIADMMLTEMQQDGSLAALLAKYGLS